MVLSPGHQKSDQNWLAVHSYVITARLLFTMWNSSSSTPRYAFFLTFICWQLTRSSLSCVKTRFAVTATSGNLTLNNLNFSTGKKSVFKKTPTKFQPVVCHDHLTLFSVQKSSSEPKPVTNAPSLVPSLLFPMFHSLVFLV